MKLTENQKNILLLLNKEHKSKLSPTRIGNKAGGYNSRGVLRHSSWACPILKSLIKKGLVIKTDSNKYAISSMGITFVKEKDKGLKK